MKFKNDYDQKRFNDLCPPIKYIAKEIEYFLVTNNCDAIITSTWSTPEEDALLKRVSKTHQEKRAVDFRSKHLPNQVKDDLLNHFNRNYKGWGAIALSDGIERLVVLKNRDSDNEHFHVQVRKDWQKIKVP